MACSELVTIVDCHIVVSYSPDMTSSGPYYFRVKAFNTDDTYLSSMWFISWLIGIPFRSYQGVDLVISTALQGIYFSLCSHKSGRINRNNYQSINRQKNNNVFHTHLRNSMLLLINDVKVSKCFYNTWLQCTVFELYNCRSRYKYY